ncbi:MAG TPA: NADH-quinone oxidoreductase subunit M [Gammaproteobacteria bacterium]|nr:NADH-quinone oxidoreductase subunit M [Gammaproteobacteria bacterium]
MPLLSLLIWLPVLGAIIVLIVGKDTNPNVSRWIALITSIITLLLCIPLYMGFNGHSYAMQFQEHYQWIPVYGINYSLGVDGISAPLIMLTVFTTLLVVIASWNAINTKVSQYLASFLVMQSMVTGVFAATDAILFYVFWEAMLIPMYLSIGIWGSANRSYASIKFFLFTFLGSALLLIVILYLRSQNHSFNIIDYYSLKLSLHAQLWIFAGFLLAFAVKVPMWPVHTWLPDAHTEAPAGGSVVLAALMLKLGAYGFLRFTLPITPDASHVLDKFMIGLSLIAIIYIGLVAIAQTDMKKLIAYSSIAHMGFVTLGSFMIFIIIRKTGSIADAYMSLEGAMVQMISHAFSSGAMFLGVGVLYTRIHSRLIKDFGGVANTMPVFAAFFMIFAMSNAGLPGTSGFVGEFMIILSAFKANFWISVAAASTLIWAAAYTLWMYKRVFFGKIANDKVAALVDINFSDKVLFTLLTIGVLGIGVYPLPLLNMMHGTVGHLLTLSLQTKVT